MRKTLIQHKEVGAGGAASIEFTTIPATYTDLYIVVSARGDGSGNSSSPWDSLLIKPNNTTLSTGKRLFGRGPNFSAASDSNLDALPPDGSATSNTFGSISYYISNYASTTQYKSISVDGVGENNANTAAQTLIAALYESNTAVTSVTLELSGQNFVQYSSASLYGVSKYNVSSGSPKATGGIISYDSATDKWVHVFAASGTFTPSENLNAEYLVIAGGGSGGVGQGGGGGAGGYRSSVSGESSGGGASAESALSLTASTGYTVIIGAGGAGVPDTTNGNSGTNSTFATITSIGGGGGGGYQKSGGLSGGSGGGGNGDNSQLGGAGTANQGFDGGNATSNGGGGGGGAGSAGENAQAGGTNGGDGGGGVSSSITGSSVGRAGGGGGGSPTTTSPGVATDGGGNGQNRDNTAASGTINTGGGGGGSDGPSGFSGAGGSGIVIVRYSA